MKSTYVFDFYNLYIPKGLKYLNTEEGVRIVPLKLAEEFEKNRTKILSPYKNGGWKTAKCYITTGSEGEAKKIAGWLESLYSFAQSRSVFFSDWYKYKNGKKCFSSQLKFIEPRENGFPELIYGTYSGGAVYTRDVSLFMNIALKTLRQSKNDKLNEVLTTIYAYLVSHSQIVEELKFLIMWIALEKLANEHYRGNQKNIFTPDEIKSIKEAIDKTLDKQLKKDERVAYLKQSLSRDYLYEHNTRQKVLSYLMSLDLGFDNRKLKKMVGSLVEIRGKLVHNLNSVKLQNKPHYLFYLQKIMERVIFRLLGMDKGMEKRFWLNQYNRGTEL